MSTTRTEKIDLLTQAALRVGEVESDESSSVYAQSAAHLAWYELLGTMKEEELPDLVGAVLQGLDGPTGGNPAKRTSQDLVGDIRDALRGGYHDTYIENRCQQYQRHMTGLREYGLI